MVPKRHAPDFAEEAVYVLSLAQEFMGLEGFEAWLVSVRAGNAVVVEETVARPLLDALEVDGAGAGK